MSHRNFTPFPILTTQRLTLRQVSVDDGQYIFALRSDKGVNKYLDRQASKTMEEAIDFIHKVNDNIKKNNSIYWAITLTKTTTLVGIICLYDFSTQQSSCEMGYELMRDFQGQGITKEAAEKVIAYAFERLQIQTIIASTHKGNQRSIQLLSKLNFIQSLKADKGNADLTIFTLTQSN